MNDTQSYIINGTSNDKDRYNVHKCMRIALANADRCVRKRESNVVWRMWSMMMLGCGNGESVFRGVCRVGSVFGFVDCECELVFMGREVRNREVRYARIDDVGLYMGGMNGMTDHVNDRLINRMNHTGRTNHVDTVERMAGAEEYGRKYAHANGDRYENREDYQSMYKPYDLPVQYDAKDRYEQQYYDAKGSAVPAEYAYDEYAVPYDTYRQYAYHSFNTYANENYPNYADEYTYKDECPNTEEYDSYYYEKGSDHSYEGKREFKNQECAHCGTRVTSLWRKLHGDTVCNACGLYYKIHGIRRPETLKGNKVRRRKRIPKKKGHYESVQ
ncbi:hypothetical protein VCUG_02569 [Vavraia culicis subsp. floridensis]|uniref:GATA-type domain-containing protein n=1 Tax=Vavraia culicis (isolate floridensis) TaxID=948595 RepID=L2GRF2_VAVCU|nr:uncharacterized protein VCUG_02569 [Vavraia culicis subsp. floridensis]ELA45942.1 hypothetical protein VCUG_02569 [Vavraia culicis subsp. floridensis]